MAPFCPIHLIGYYQAMRWHFLTLVVFLAGCQGVPTTQSAPPAVNSASIANAIESGNESEVAKMLENKDALKFTDADGNTPLHLAARYSQPKIGELLIEAGANVSAKNKNGQTPIGMSVAEGQGKLVELLLDHGADLSYVSKGDWSLLHWAIGTGNSNLVEKMLADGADANTQDDGRSVLYTAALSGTPAMVTALIKHGAKVESRTQSGETPLFAAVRMGKSGVDALLKGKANINAENKSGMTAMEVFAVQNSDPKTHKMDSKTAAMVAYLWNHGAVPAKLKWLKNSSGKVKAAI
ncbi:hypothetical protein BH11ARM1_BH11ARM1_10670 [soil metagenome]